LTSSSLDELKKAVIDQKKVLFPYEAEDPALSELHQAVKEMDELVSQVVIQALQRNLTSLPTAKIDEVQAKIQVLLARPEIEQNRHVSFYRSYLARLTNMLQIAKRSSVDALES